MERYFSNMQRIDHWQGFPHRQFSSIHITGTNGKGSVSLKIATALQATGLRVGLYTSPHISSFRERIQINGVLISEEFVTAFLQKLFSFIEKESIQPSFFELLTALAFAYFANEKVDIAVVEVGAGGRLDATNVVTPILSVITSIDFDHMEILGETLDEIAAAKAGIIKPGIPTVVGPRACFKPIMRAAEGYLIFAPAAKGFYDRENNSIARSALEALKISEAAIVRGLACRPPCRFEIVDSRPIILDVAHNPDGFSHLCEAVKEQFENRLFHVMLAIGKGRDPVRCVEKIRPIVSRIVCVSNINPRHIPAEELANRLNEVGFSKTYVAPIEEVLQNPEPLLICGSPLIMADVRRLLGIREPVDPLTLVPQIRIR